MNNYNGELTKKAEMFEMDFLREMGVDTLGKYPDVEKHIDKITNILIGEYDIDSAIANLLDLKRLVQSMKKSNMKTNLMNCIVRIEMDLC